MQFTDSDGKRKWKCLWCNSTFQQWNATKALLHVHRVSGNNIQKCKSRSIDAVHQALYAQLYKRNTARKQAQKEADESKKRSSDEYIVNAGEAYAATSKRKKLSPFTSTGTPPDEITPSSQIPHEVNIGSEDPKQQSSQDTQRYIQTKLTDTVDSQAESQLTMAIADLIHSCGLPFSLASHHKFHRVLSLAKFATKKYIPPGRNKVGGELLDLNYDIYIKNTHEALLKEADVYGLTFFGDAATVKKLPMINILASSVHLPVGCLRIADCSAHLQADGTKDASYISGLFIPHILEMEKRAAKCTDLVIFDGASNVQKAGALLEAKFPHISAIHGAEHVISLFYQDVFELRPFATLKNLNRIIYRYFGSGSMHSPYAIFSKHSRDHNGGKPIGLIRAADTRMGGHVISMLRTLRLKDSLISTISSASFLQGKFPVSLYVVLSMASILAGIALLILFTYSTLYQQIDNKVISILKRESTWDFMAKFVRAVFPMLIVLRLADQKEPVMDKLLFYVHRMDKSLEKSKSILDDLEERMKGPAWRAISDIKSSDLEDDDSDSCVVEDDDNGTLASTDDECTTDTNKKTLGEQVQYLWMKRRHKLVTDFAIAGWLLSPLPDVYADSSLNMTGEYRDAVDRLIQKIMASEYSDDSDELSMIMNTFWDEFEQFKSKTGPFQKSYIWSDTNRDLLVGKSHFWHKKNSYFQTTILGKFACRVCSKIVGMGSAERNWGDVKYLKSEKRSHLSAEAVEKQATIFGASCMMDADIERKKVQSNTEERYKFWEDDDFDNEFDILRPTVYEKSDQRTLKCYFEAWEDEHLRNKSDVSKAKFLRKYGGLEFDDVDKANVHYRICDQEMVFRRRFKEDRGGWSIVAYNDKNEKQTWILEKGCPLHDCIATYYRKHPELKTKVLIRKDQVDDIEYLLSVTNKSNVDSSKDVDNQTESDASNDALPQPHPKSLNKKARLSKTPTKTSKSPSKQTTKKVNEKNSPSKCSKEDNDMRPCGGCGKNVGPVHKCDRCNRNMHVFCGRTIGEEGYGSCVRCPTCDH